MAVAFRSFTLAFIQLAKIETDKAKNLDVAQSKIREVASGEKKPDLIVLPVRGGFCRFADKRSDWECQEFFNTPLGEPSLIPTHAEEIGFTPGKPYDITASKSDSVKMLSAVAKETGTWLIGGDWLNGFSKERLNDAA
jgi:omega-amidase